MVWTVMTYLIAVHALCGTAALILGLTALTARKRRGRHTRVGEAYVWTLLPLLATGVVIGYRDPALSPFEIAVFPTAIPLLMGYLAGKERAAWLGRPWFAWHIGGMGGSYIGVVTAGLFQLVLRAAPPTTPVVVLTFALPSIVGTWLIVRAVARRTPSPRRSTLSRSAPAPSAAHTPRAPARFARSRS
jgi:hypothetical protein